MDSHALRYTRALISASLFHVFGFAAPYDQARAIDYANLAGAAYCLPETIKQWACGSKCIPGVEYVNVKLCKGYSTLSYAAQWNGQCVAVFEGTHDLTSMGIDLLVAKREFPCHSADNTPDCRCPECRPCEGCGVHVGFLDEWLSHKECLTKKLNEIGCGRDQPKPLHMTGHSLGGAVATVGAMWLKLSGWSIAELYTFGSPRVGEANFADKFATEFKGIAYRVTHGKDPMVDMPPPSAMNPFVKYVHVEPEVFYEGNVSAGYVICSDPEDPRCSAQYGVHWQMYLHERDRAYHHNYMGVDTTQGDCRGKKLGCGDRIPNSWCNVVAPCNEDIRGPTVCTSSTLGMCKCQPGYCPNDYGRCVAQPNTCFTDTGGTCLTLPCKASRGAANCVDGHCVCPRGYCSDTHGSCHAETSGQDCAYDTGGTCQWLACEAWRGATFCSASGRCLCKKGYCADRDGSCSMAGTVNKCDIETAGTCKWFNCDQSLRGPTLCTPDYKCVCRPGYCALDGKCQHANSTVMSVRLQGVREGDAGLIRICRAASFLALVAVALASIAVFRRWHGNRNAGELRQHLVVG